MKKIFLMVLATAMLFSCQKENLQDETVVGASTLNLKINVNKVLSRAVEDGHDGINDAKVSPKIFTVTVLSYNSSGTQLGVTDLTAAQINDALWGNYRDSNGQLGTQTTPPSGATIGLPKGTTHVDVVVNRAPITEYTNETNINYVNYRDNKNGNGTDYMFGNDNFDRVILTTNAYGMGGAALQGNEVADAKTPTYEMNFQVKPYLTRMEVHGGINVAEETVWIDGYKNQWRTMTVAAYELASGDTPDADGKYPKGAVKGTAANGFDENTVYIPEYYWYRAIGSTADPVERTPANQHEYESNVDDPSTDNAGWVRQPYYATATVQVKWYPNRYYAIDVESIFVNNIKVRDAQHTPYLHPWPGNEVATGWPDWYKAYHIGGWHTAGVSTGNTFLCLGNMWDRIATSQQTMAVSFPELNGVSQMDILTGKALPIANKSEYYDKTNNRNLGFASGRAAAYGLYPQAKSLSTSSSDAAKLRNELPHIILKIKAYKTAADYAAGNYLSGKEFITISLFSDTAGGAGNYITGFQGGYIYRFNLNELIYSFVGDVPVPGGKPTDGKDPKDPVDPDPEMPGSQLIMRVEVLQWTINNIYPVI